MEDKLINLEDMRSLFRKRLWIIIVVTALTTVLGIYKTRQMAPTYTCSMKFLVSTSDKILDNYSENEIEAYSKFMATFNEIMKVGDFLDDTLKKNKISKTSDQVKYAISYSVSTTAPIFTLNYTSSSTNEMEDILNAVCEKFEYEIKEIDSRVKVKILEEPTTYREGVKKMFIVNKMPQSLSAESYRSIRTSIKYSSVDNPIKTIVITSSNSSEGKSTVAGNLAFSLSQNGSRTLLIDCDLRKPSVHKKFLIPNDKGLTDVLFDKQDLKEVIKKIENNLYVLPFGTIPTNPAEILGYKTME